MKKKEPQKRVNVVSLQLVKESSLLYGPRRITSTRQAYELFEPYLKEKDREHLYVVGLNTKKEPTFLNLITNISPIIFHILGALTVIMMSINDKKARENRAIWEARSEDE